MNPLYALFIILSVADVATTLYVLAHGGYEENKALAWLIAKMGAFGLVLAKVVILLAVGYLIRHGAPLAAMIAPNVFTAWAVLHNWRTIRKMGKRP